MLYIIYRRIHSFLARWWLCLFSFRHCLCLFCLVLGYQVVLAILGYHPVIVNIVFNFSWNVNIGMLFIPVEEEEVLVEYWLGRCFFARFNTCIFSCSDCCLVVLIFSNLLFVLNFEFINGFSKCSCPTFCSLLSFLFFLLSFLTLHF